MMGSKAVSGLAGLMAIAVVSGAMVASAGPSAQSLSARETTSSVQRALERLPYYGVFDFMAFNVDRGAVTLTGYAYHGSLRNAAESATRRTSGVDEVANRIELLPASQNDDRIRWATFYSIYTDAFLSRYAPGGPDQIRREIYDSRRFPGMHQPLGLYAIHIVVRNGHTTLFGIVDNEGDRQIAEVRAREVTGVFSVNNEIVVTSKESRTGG
jgi:hyperosmotically inducible periplasmic protein